MLTEIRNVLVGQKKFEPVALRLDDYGLLDLSRLGPKL